MDLNSLLRDIQRMENSAEAAQQSSDERQSLEVPSNGHSTSEVLSSINELQSRLTQTGAQDIQESRFLGSTIVDLPEISKKAESPGKGKTSKPSNPYESLQSFLEKERQNAILSVIEGVQRNTSQLAKKKKREDMKSNWEQEKIKLIDAMVGPSQNWIDLQKLAEKDNSNKISGASNIRDRIEEAYIRRVFEYNRIMNAGTGRPNLVLEFATAAKSFQNEKVNELWEVLSTMINALPVSGNQDPIQNRVQMGQLADLAKKFLENRYKTYMKTKISENLREAQSGEVDMVFSFVRLTFKEANCLDLKDGSIDGRPLWPLVYCSLRSGNLKSALRFLQLRSIGNEELIQVLEDKINKPEQKIDSELKRLPNWKYRTMIENFTDPYKRTVYCIVAGCDASDQQWEVAETIDDFLWIRLSLLETGASSNLVSDMSVYSGLQAQILENYGGKYFKADEQRNVYFRVLTLTGQFEAAIEFLFRTDEYREHAVHMAIALNEMSLLGTPRNIEQPLLSVDIGDPVPMRRLNLARLLMVYVKEFVHLNPDEALQYYFFLRNLKDPSGQNLFLICVSDLAIGCEDYELILGKVMPNGILEGLFSQFKCVNFDYKAVAAMAADEKLRKGEFADAIKLFELAEMPNQSLQHLSLQLAQVVRETSQYRSCLTKLATHFYNRIGNNQIQCDPQAMATFMMLYELVKFYDYFHAEKYRAAINVLENAKLLPVSMGDVAECVKTFKNLSCEICKLFPDILLTAMDILFAEYEEIKASRSSARSVRLHKLRQQAKAITNLAVTIPYPMPKNTHNRLIITEVRMN